MPSVGPAKEGNAADSGDWRSHEAPAAAASKTQRVPLTLRRYLRVNIAASATAGNNTGSHALLALAF